MSQKVLMKYNKKREDTNLLHNLPEEIQKRIMAIERSRSQLNYFKSIKYEESVNSSNYLGDLVYRLSLKSPYRNWGLILRLLGVTDMFTFMNKASILNFRDRFSKRNNINYIQNLVRDNHNLHTPFTIEEEASIILDAINRLYKDIIDEQHLSKDIINKTFKAFMSDSKKIFTTTKQGNRQYSKVYRVVTDIDTTFYITEIMRILKILNVYDIIVMNKVNIKQLQQPYKDWLLQLQQLLKERYQIFTLLIKTGLFTQHEAIHVDNSLRGSSVKIEKTEDLMNITQKHFDQLFLLSEDKKEILNKFFQEQKIKLTKGSSSSSKGSSGSYPR